MEERSLSFHSFPVLGEQALCSSLKGSCQLPLWRVAGWMFSWETLTRFCQDRGSTPDRCQEMPAGQYITLSLAFVIVMDHTCVFGTAWVTHNSDCCSWYSWKELNQDILWWWRDEETPLQEKLLSYYPRGIIEWDTVDEWFGVYSFFLTSFFKLFPACSCGFVFSSVQGEVAQGAG